MQDTASHSNFCRDRAEAARREAASAVAPDIREQWLDLARHWDRLAQNAEPDGERRAPPRPGKSADRKSNPKSNDRAPTLSQDITTEEEPTPEAAARHILRVFVAEFNRRPFDVLLVNSFAGRFAAAPWRPADFDRGLDHARRQGWIEANGPLLTLTDLGYAAT
jgi:hypothetical protein